MADAIPLDEGDGPFTVGDFDELSPVVVAAWRSGVDLDWTASAGALEWSCWTTADHTVDCVFSYALFLASRRQDRYPPFGELHALTEATPAGLGIDFDPSADRCRRLLMHTSGWPFVPAMSPTDDPWSDLLERSGRPRRNRG